MKYLFILLIATSCTKAKPLINYGSSAELVCLVSVTVAVNKHPEVYNLQDRKSLIRMCEKYRQ